MTVWMGATEIPVAPISMQLSSFISPGEDADDHYI